MRNAKCGMRNECSSPSVSEGLRFCLMTFFVLVMAGCVTEQVTKKSAPAPEQQIDPIVLEVQTLVMKKALGGLRDMDMASLEESGWPAGIEEGRRIQENPIRFMNQGLRRDLAMRQYRVRYFLEKTADQKTTETAASPAPNASAQTADAPTTAPDAPAQTQTVPQPSAPGENGHKKYILVTVPATMLAAPLPQAAPYVFVVERVGGRFQITQSDFIPSEYMEGLNDDAILKKLLADI